MTDDLSPCTAPAGCGESSGVRPVEPQPFLDQRHDPYVWHEPREHRLLLSATDGVLSGSFRAAWAEDIDWLIKALEANRQFLGPPRSGQP